MSVYVKHVCIECIRLSITGLRLMSHISLKVIFSLQKQHVKNLLNLFTNKEICRISMIL